MHGGAGDDTFVVEGDDGNYDSFDGGMGNDQIMGGAGDDVFHVNTFSADNSIETIDGGAGTNVISGGWMDDTIDLSTTHLINIARIQGGNGNDHITGTSGNDNIAGGGDTDTLSGGLGNDTYLFARGDGSDTVIDDDTTVGNTDVALFESGISTDQLWFRHVGNNLEVSIIGTNDKLVVNNWYTGNQYHVEQFKTSNGKTLLDSQVQNLVDAMASFSPPAAGQTTLPANYSNSLSSVIATNWQ
jgi:Ca2+-binding RTX toxin-like protein